MPGEEDLIFEYLNLLVSRPEVARALGDARQGLCRAGVQLGDVARAVRGVPGGGGQQGNEWRSRPAEWPPSTAPPRPPAASRSRHHRLPAKAGRQRRLCASYLDTHQTRLHQDAGNHAARAARTIASWRWARICRSRRRCAPGWATAKCAAATTASSGRVDHRTRDLGRAAKPSSATSISSTPRRTASPTPTSTSPPCSAAS